MVELMEGKEGGEEKDERYRHRRGYRMEKNGDGHLIPSASLRWASLRETC